MFCNSVGIHWALISLLELVFVVLDSLRFVLIVVGVCFECLFGCSIGVTWLLLIKDCMLDVRFS